MHESPGQRYNEVRNRTVRDADHLAHNPKVVGSNPTPRHHREGPESLRFRAFVVVDGQSASPALSTGSGYGSRLTWCFAAVGPVDVYRVALAMRAANWSAAAELIPGITCW